jgi:hypothetical protein
MEAERRMEEESESLHLEAAARFGIRSNTRKVMKTEDRFPDHNRMWLGFTLKSQISLCPLYQTEFSGKGLSFSTGLPDDETFTPFSISIIARQIHS